MQWEEVRKIYPDQYVKLQILTSHTEGNTKYVDEVALIKAIEDPKEATQELLRSKDGTIVSHTSNEELKIELRALRGLQGQPIPMFKLYHIQHSFINSLNSLMPCHTYPAA